MESADNVSRFIRFLSVLDGGMANGSVGISAPEQSFFIVRASAGAELYATLRSSCSGVIRNPQNGCGNLVNHGPPSQAGERVTGMVRWNKRIVWNLECESPKRDCDYIWVRRGEVRQRAQREWKSLKVKTSFQSQPKSWGAAFKPGNTRKMGKDRFNSY